MFVEVEKFFEQEMNCYAEDDKIFEQESWEMFCDDLRASHVAKGIELSERYYSEIIKDAVKDAEVPEDLCSLVIDHAYTFVGVDDNYVIINPYCKEENKEKLLTHLDKSFKKYFKRAMKSLDDEWDALVKKVTLYDEGIYNADKTICIIFPQRLLKQHLLEMIATISEDIAKHPEIDFSKSSEATVRLYKYLL